MVKTALLNPAAVSMARALRYLQRADPVLSALIERVGPYRKSYREPTFESLVRSIVYQQLNGRAASTIYARLETLAGKPLMPESILPLSDGQMRAVGLSRQKLSYIRDLAARTASGEIEFARLPDMSDQDVIEHLTRVKGIGNWTAHMFLIFALRRPNVLPTGDLAVEAAMRKLYRKRKLLKPAQMEKIAKCWEPYRSVACWYLWRSLDVETLEE